MKLNAVGVSSRDISRTVEFYRILGFAFQPYAETDRHIESVNNLNAKLMIDHISMVEEILGDKPRPSNHANFAIQYDTPAELNLVVDKLQEAGYAMMKPAWDAFWGQRYVVVKDPDGYMVDLYAYL